MLGVKFALAEEMGSERREDPTELYRKKRVPKENRVKADASKIKDRLRQATGGVRADREM